MPESSRDEIAKLEALYANNPEGRVFTHLAEAYRKAGELDRARTILESGLTKHQGYASAHVVLGRVLVDLEKPEEAELSFRRVLALDPHNLVALRSMGDISRAAGRTDEALEYFEELRHLDPNNTDVAQITEELRNTPVSAIGSPPVEEPQSAAETFEEPQPSYQSEPEQSYQQEPDSYDSPADAPFEYTSGAGYEAPEPPPEAPAAQEVTPETDLEWLSASNELNELPGDLAGFAGGSYDSGFAAEEGASNELGDLSSLGSGTGEEEIPADEVFQMGDFGFESAQEEEPVQETAPQGEVLTETIAELYRAQGLNDRAAEVYRALLKERPDDENLKAKLREVEGFGPEDVRAPEVVESSEPESAEPWETAATDAPWETPSAEAPWETPVSEAPWEATTSDAPWATPVSESPEELPFDITAPEAVSPESAELESGEPETPTAEPAGAENFALEPVAQEAGAQQTVPDDAEGWLAGGAGVVESAPTPYAWTDQASTESSEAGPPISDYFRSLLAWRPERAAAPIAPAAPTPQTAAPIQSEPEPWTATSETPAIETEEAEPFMLLEEPISTTPAPAAEAASPMPWEEPASAGPAATPPATAQAPPSPGAGSDASTAGEAFDAWFGEPAAPEAASPGASDASMQDEPGTGDDDDLEMFRSWLQSLKK